MDHLRPRVNTTLNSLHPPIQFGVIIAANGHIITNYRRAHVEHVISHLLTTIHPGRNIPPMSALRRSYTVGISTMGNYMVMSSSVDHIMPKAFADAVSCLDYAMTLSIPTFSTVMV
jgi:hypothetical protein